MSIDVTRPVLRRDRGGVGARCGCGADLPALRAQLDAIAAAQAAHGALIHALAEDVSDLVVETRGLRADLARRRASCEHDGRDEALGVLASQLVGDDVFLAADILVLAVTHPPLQHALAAVGASNAKKLGCLFARLEGREMDGGVEIIRLGVDRGGVLWRFLRI